MKLTKFYPVDINNEKFQKHWRNLAFAYYLKNKGAYLLEEERKKYEKDYSEIFHPVEGKVIDIDSENNSFEVRDLSEADNINKSFDDFYIIKIDDKDREALSASTIVEFEETIALSKEDWKIIAEEKFD